MKTDMRSEIILSTLVICTVLVAGCTQTDTAKPGDKAHVTDVVDGDTLEVDVRGNKVTVRLQGVDTPEVHMKNNASEWECNMTRDHLRDYGKKASAFVKKNYNNTDVRLVYQGKGDYGRTVASVHKNETMLGEQLLRKGLAQTYTSSSFNNKDNFLQIESKMRREKIGVWSAC